LNLALWIVQILLALAFLAHSGLYLTAPASLFTDMVGIDPLFGRFIGAVEMLGALGLVVPAVTRIRPGLVPLAAAGLAIIMVGAVGLHLAQGLPAFALAPGVLLLLAAFVAYGRWRLVPLAPRGHATAVHAGQ